ncbi:MAG: caspase family protein [Ardenticatenaceae bacterium]
MMGQQEPRKLALMIGINKYKYLGRRFQLRGCVNDQKMLKGLLLERFDFEEENIEMLFDEEATRANIIKALDRLAGMGEYEGDPLVEEGDFVFVSYSGHGSRLKEPPDQQDEADGYDSTVVPYDSDRPRRAGKGGPNLDITDDELHARFEKIQARAGHLLLYFDCCHSGTISRDLTGELERSLVEDDRYEGVERVWPFTGKLVPTGPSGWLPMDEGYVLIAGCADDEKAREYKDPVTKEPCGALTYHIVQEMARVEGQATYRDVFERAKGDVNRLFGSQNPQMEGDWNRQLFNAQEVKVEPFTKIKLDKDNPGQVELQVGSAHGTTVNSYWELRAPDLEQREPLAYLLVRSVKALKSIADVITPPSREVEWDDFIANADQFKKDAVLPDTVNDDCRAIQVVHALGDFRVPVGVHGTDEAQVNELRARIEGSAVLKLVPQSDVQMLAALIEPRSEEESKQPDSYAPELGEVEVPTWGIVGRDGAMMPSPPHTIEEEDALDLTFSNLETWARYFNTHQIRPVGKDPLRGKFTAELYLMPEDGDLDDLEPLEKHEESGLPLVEDGQEVLLHLYNHHSRPLYFFLFSMDAMGAIKRVYPPIGAKEPIPPYDDFPLGVKANLPDNFPEVLDGARETYKIMVTMEYANFDVMVQEGARADEVNDASEWYGAATRGASMSSVRPLKKKIDKDAWTTVQIDYYIEAGGGI